jgi:diguanylate cyclase (GGDEF)-like protein
MNIGAALIYWLIVAIWISVLFASIAFYINHRRTFVTVRLLLVVLALDALRNVIENVYFGLYFGSKLGLLPAIIGIRLSHPYFLIMPKIANVGAGGIVLGVLFCRWLPQAVREQAQAALQVQHLNELATTDSMTGLKNRREFMALADAEWLRSVRYQRNLSLVILDIDNFKAVNDRYGHQVGDKVIMVIGKICNAAKRTSDIAGRIGGEEFAILLPETTTTAAHLFAQRLRLLIASEAIEDGMVMATVSIGVSNAVHMSSISELMKQADLALYEAKRTGRNRVCDFGMMGVYRPAT